MKISFALIRKEADTFLSQGLHEEALELYAKFVACSAKIDPGTKSAIAKQIQLIEFEMNCGDTGADRVPSTDRIDIIENGWEASTGESSLLLCAEDPQQRPGCNQKDEKNIEDADWLDPLADIYALVSNDKDYSPSAKLSGKALFNESEDSKELLNQDSPKKKSSHRGYTVKSFLKGIVAFVLVGSLFLYFIDWFSEVKRIKSREVVQKAPIIVFKKMPTFFNNENTSTLPNIGMEDYSAMLSKEKAVIGDAQPIVDPAETQEAVKNLSSPTNVNKIENRTPIDDFQKDGTSYSEIPDVENTDTITASEEPDPASVIDYVLKKRGL